MPRPPSYQKVNPAEQPMLYLSLDSDTLPLYTVNEYAETLLAQRISMVSGVSRVQVFGAQKYAVRVQVDPDQLAAHGIGIDEVQSAIASSNTNLPTGRLDGAQQAFTIESNGTLPNAAAYRPMIVAWRNGAPVRLEQLGNVVDGVENDKLIAWYNDRRARDSGHQRQPGTNTVEVVDNVKRAAAGIPPARFPPRCTLDVAFDASQSIRNSIRDVEFTLLLTVVHRGDGDLPVPAQPFRHPDSRRGGAVLDRRHVRGDVPAGLQPEQPFADGADALGGLRGGRRHRDAGKHRAPHGNGRVAHARRRWRLRAKSASPSFP